MVGYWEKHTTGGYMATERGNAMAEKLTVGRPERKSGWELGLKEWLVPLHSSKRGRGTI